VLKKKLIAPFAFIVNMIQLLRVIHCNLERPLRRARNILAVAATVFALAACDTTPAAFDGGITAALPGTAAYVLAPGDKVKINVFNEPDLTGEFQIDENGNIAFPLLGAIPAGGMVLDEFRLKLTEHLRNGYVRQPRVSVDIVNYRPINIIGEVRNAGQYAYRPGVSAQDIAAIAGGYTYRANQHKLYITRGQNQKQITVDLDEGRFLILPGDTIKIPERYF
jgi:polysaccharide export outer membrane protein